MLKDFNAVRITVASPQDMLNWSHGEVTKAETINYRTFRSEPAGLMAEEIFGPTKDFECYCGKYKKIRYKGIVCDRCGVEVTHKRVRRERMGHIKLAAPVAHVWFSNGVPNRLSLILDIPQKKLETVIYYARYVVTAVDLEEQKKALESLPELKKKELEEIGLELDQRIEEVHKEFDEKRAEVKKEKKDSAKLELQTERINKQEKLDIAHVKAASKQRIDNLDKKFDDLKKLIESLSMSTTLSEEENSMLQEYIFFFFEASMGAEAIQELLRKLDIESEIVKLDEEMRASKSQLRKSRITQRLRILKGIHRSGMRPEWLILSILPVVPPDLRPIIQLPGGRFATNDLNDLYRRVINRNNRLQRLINLGAPEIILRNEKRMLQEAVDSLLDNNHKPGAPALNTRQMPYKSLSDNLRGKQGRFRQNLLGKRVDYSGRAVIVGGPELRFDQCGLPKNVAVELFRPFIIRELMARGFAANPTRAKMIFESREPEVWDILEDVSKDRPVLLNRAPSLHRYSILAFYPILIEGNAIRLHPMVCKGFNADFDGDQMAVHVPLSDEAVEEAKSRMFAKDNMLSLRNGAPIVTLEKDIATSIFFLTLMRGKEEEAKHSFGNSDEAITAYNLGIIRYDEPMKVLLDRKVYTTTVGRIKLNQVLPEGFEFINKELAISDVSSISAEIFLKYGNDISINVLDDIKTLGFKYGTKSGYSISMGDFRFGANNLVQKKLEEYDLTEQNLLNEYYEGMITEVELKRLKIEAWQEKVKEIHALAWEIAQGSAGSEALINIAKSGGVKVADSVRQISGVRGLVQDMEGHIVPLPLRGNYEKGLNNFEYFVASKAVRKSMTDVALKTAESGYLTRRLVDVCQDIIVKIDDCKTTEGVPVSKEDKRSLSFEKRIKGRYLASDAVTEKGKIVAKAGDLITIDISKEFAENDDLKMVHLRSPLMCRVAHGICQTCYGYDNGTGKTVKVGEAIGIVAAQALGEPTTQLTLKSKSDARGGKTDVTQGLPRVDELLEARTPKAVAHLADFDGVIAIIEDKKHIVIRLIAQKKEVKSYKLEKDDTVVVKSGKKVKAGDVIAVKSDQSEIKAPMTGKVVLEDGKVMIEAQKEIESEKYVAQMSDLLVTDGEAVTKGQQLSVGSIDPKEMLKLRTPLEAQDYIIEQVQNVYSIQGLDVDDRHLEIVTRQMCRYALISDTGDSDAFLAGDYIDVIDMEYENLRLKQKGLKPIKGDRVLLGITNSSLRTESFLSAASFEQQVRVLTEAALVGKVDHLRGLKENVIIGRPVPLGELLINKNHSELEEVRVRVEALNEAKISLN